MHQHILDTETRSFGHLLHALCAVLTIASIWAAYSFLYTPMVAGSGDIRRQIDGVMAKLRSAPEIRKEHSELRGRLTNVTQRMQRLRSRIPKDDRLTQFVAEVTEAAEQEGITISDFGPGQRMQRNGYSEREITFTGTGSYPGICQFVSSVQALPRLTKITGLEVRAGSVGQKSYPVTLRVLIYFGLTIVSETENEPQVAMVPVLGGGMLHD